MSPENAIQDRYDAFDKMMAEHDAPFLYVIGKLVDRFTCRYDHNGLCQEHSLNPRPCPHELAKELLAKQT